MSSLFLAESQGLPQWFSAKAANAEFGSRDCFQGS